MSENWDMRIRYLITAAVDADASPSEENEMLLETERTVLRSAIADLQHSYDEAMLQYDMAQKRACNAESQLKEAELDALTLADELTDEQNPGFICQALKLHYARLAGKEGE